MQNISPLGKLFTFFVRRQHQRNYSHFVSERALIPLTFFRVRAIKIGIRPTLPKKEERAYMHLNEAQKDKDYIVKSIGLPFETERRLQALGMTDDTPIRVVNRKGKGILVVKLRGTRFAFGYNITKNIEVEEAPDEQQQ